MTSGSEVCRLCQYPIRLQAIDFGLHWTLNIAEDATNRPWLVLQTKRCVDSLGKLDAFEAKELADHQVAIIAHLESLPGVRRGHIVYLNETTPSHVHMHFSVSALADPFDLYAFQLDAPWPSDGYGANLGVPRAIWMPKAY